MTRDSHNPPLEMNHGLTAGLKWREDFDLAELRALEVALREFMRRKTTARNLFAFAARVHVKISAGLEALEKQEPTVPDVPGMGPISCSLLHVPSRSSRDPWRTKSER